MRFILNFSKPDSPALVSFKWSRLLKLNSSTVKFREINAGVLTSVWESSYNLIRGSATATAGLPTVSSEVR